mmetsp:Transcript_9402/g.38503  ORF Transcript_9402/g.38503 Transcript_9402/m.38503 type:complete len:403 (-) Transcript_9402:740-1948(-)
MRQPTKDEHILGKQPPLYRVVGRLGSNCQHRRPGVYAIVDNVVSGVRRVGNEGPGVSNTEGCARTREVVDGRLRGSLEHHRDGNKPHCLVILGHEWGDGGLRECQHAVREGSVDNGECGERQPGHEVLSHRVLAASVLVEVAQDLLASGVPVEVLLEVVAKAAVEVVVTHVVVHHPVDGSTFRVRRSSEHVRHRLNSSRDSTGRNDESSANTEGVGDNVVVCKAYVGRGAFLPGVPAGKEVLAANVLQVTSKSLVVIRLRPPRKRNHVAEPHMHQLVGNNLRCLLVLSLRTVVAVLQQPRRPIRHEAHILHAVLNDLGHCDLVKLIERVRHVKDLRPELDELNGDVEGECRVLLLARAAVDSVADSVAVRLEVRQLSNSEGNEVGRDGHRRLLELKGLLPSA